ncbi:hypothetical protein C8N24_1588 [Solirubrobacter pauli]|uniref:Hemolysin type calcium-binding protein n=1 Tax=Solirubrobacter pauli TaxID=166793 RepID=A0A660LD01_9ACTN|nr:hypothetical protein [Solirubrobacter pauli]RKQ91760.1 hypothetical protein C8N24_1588 [Solirubrobacter pauli]
MHRKLLVGALAATAAVAAIPSAANAATCNYSSASKQMEIRYRAGETALTVKPGGTIQYTDGNSLLNCFDSTTGRAATPATTAKLLIKAPTGAGAAPQLTILDESTATFADFNRQLDIFVLTGTNDQLRLQRGPRKDLIHLMDQSGGLAIGPMIDLDFNGEPDVRMTTNNSLVRVDAGGGDDAVDATGVVSYRTSLFGEGGNDFLFGTKQADVIDGGLNTDTASRDFKDSITSIETLL